jgi:stage V sporulation protein R
MWGKPVQLETSEIVHAEPAAMPGAAPGARMTVNEAAQPQEIKWQRVLYTMNERRLTREVL